MEKKVPVLIRSVYGVERIFPANETGIAFVTFAKKKTFEIEDLKLVKGLGFDIEIEDGKRTELGKELMRALAVK